MGDRLDMISELSSRDISTFVLECHRALRSHMLSVMRSDTSNEVIPLMFEKAFTGNAVVKTMFSGWCKLQGTEAPGWKDYIKFMNLLVEYQEVELAYGFTK